MGDVGCGWDVRHVIYLSLKQGLGIYFEGLSLCLVFCAALLDERVEELMNGIE